MKINLRLLIILIIIILVIYLWYNHSNENYTTIDKPIQYTQMNTQNQPMYYDTWYAPVQEYFNISANGYPDQKTSCELPSKISVNCYNQRLVETGDANLAMQLCQLPSSISETC